jgi:hypothetical protein
MHHVSLDSPLRTCVDNDGIHNIWSERKSVYPVRPGKLGGKDDHQELCTIIRSRDIHNVAVRINILSYGLTSENMSGGTTAVGSRPMCSAPNACMRMYCKS